MFENCIFFIDTDFEEEFFLTMSDKFFADKKVTYN